ncbi:hypothetical protein BESB_033910 [Besnoitia besnoiti]|uniref:SRS domain-containing protein n=1 Tax=Besnoitia besnoiti TaxID=94643 RepID=A0A2A9MMC0_BESBE|nr:hypothetical protein BESB_033910 [Besnoitia besnoiti]PFH36933.1 hypothetical protein BESB_033910 [Besnoitia besnoiti]
MIARYRFSVPVGLCATLLLVSVLQAGASDAIFIQPLPGEKNICTAPEGVKGILLTLKKTDTSISFSCESTEDMTLYPQLPTTTFFVQEDCKFEDDLQNVCKGAAIKKLEGAEQHTYMLSMPLPGRTSRDLYFSCGKRPADDVSSAKSEPAPKSPKKNCIVKIKVEPTDEEVSSGPGGPEQNDNHLGDEQGSGITECRSGSVTASLSVEKPLTFECGESLVLEPKSTDDVFDDSDGECRIAVKLSSLLDAAMKKLNDKKEKYTLTASAAPLNHTALCYRCVFSEQAAKPPPSRSMRSGAEDKKECTLKVYVKGTSGAASLGASSWPAFAGAMGAFSLGLIIGWM